MDRPEKFKYIVSTPNKKEDRFKFHEDCGYNRAIEDYEAWLKELIPKEKKVPECLNDASVGDYEIGFNDAITEIKKKLKHRR